MGVDQSQGAYGIDFDRIALGDPLATRDGVWRLVKLIEDERLLRFRDDLRPTRFAATASYTVPANGGRNQLIDCDATSGAITVTAYTAVGHDGDEITVKKSDTSANAVTVSPDGSELFDALSSFVLYKQGDYVRLRSEDSKWVIAGSKTTIKARAYLSASQTGVVTATLTKVELDTEDFDTAAAFDSTTNYRFVKPSWLPANSEFRVTGMIDFENANGNTVEVTLVVNGSGQQAQFRFQSPSGGASIPVIHIVQLDGSDYIELFGEHNRGSNDQFNGSSDKTYMDVEYVGPYAS